MSTPRSTPRSTSGSTTGSNPRFFFILQKFDKIASLQKVQKSHLHIAVSIPLSSRNFIIQKTKKGGGGGGWWFKLKMHSYHLIYSLEKRNILQIYI